ncbi:MULTISPECIES: ADP-ribosylglycohydrolase family protein [unclassified Arthrobacter]|uniref:ADP-ribosylglycohydrolase family protein n=1 Tax=unclassified Arthrobacter TaxID=235627 RepID=UPI0014924374|nr:ADP-ribosylglycohydrolase family protein [Arthrobacter sp. AET 35A]MBE0010470.1 ADP-ribosylglycohydrolase family protein [Arthrobacter sp. AET 35A]NOJ62370.1 ADP-ribosylglycohydrolase family protein [Arthrobacter sp. 147(2020)]
MLTDPTFSDRVHGCLLGGALGDALGFAVETLDLESIRAAYGPAGLTSPTQLSGVFRFSDDTQLSLYTVDGLVDAIQWANEGVAADETACLWLAYLRWLATQGETPPSSAPIAPPRWIDAQTVLRHRRRPGAACLSGLRGGEMGTLSRPVNSEAKGSGTVMRSAPFGLVPHIPVEVADRLAMNAAALTHGHPAALHGAAVVAVLIHGIVRQGMSLREAVSAAVARAHISNVAELAEFLETAVRLADDDGSPEQMSAALGGGWTADEALAIAVYAVLASEAAAGPEQHFRAAIALAINHDGDSDTTGSLAGNILGALYGRDGLPDSWAAALEGADVVTSMARLLVDTTSAG